MYAELRRNRSDLDLSVASTGAAVEQAMTSWEAAHTNQFVDVPQSLQTNFFGFNSGGKMSGLFDFVLVTDRNLLMVSRASSAESFSSLKKCDEEIYS